MKAPHRAYLRRRKIAERRALRATLAGLDRKSPEATWKEKDLPSKIAYAVSVWRENYLNWSRQYLARSAGLPVSRVRAIEGGSKRMTIADVQAICDAMDAPLQLIIQGEYSEELDPWEVAYRIARNMDDSMQQQVLRYVEDLAGTRRGRKGTPQ